MQSGGKRPSLLLFRLMWRILGRYKTTDAKCVQVQRRGPSVYVCMYMFIGVVSRTSGY